MKTSKTSATQTAETTKPAQPTIEIDQRTAWEITAACAGKDAAALYVGRSISNSVRQLADAAATLQDKLGWLETAIADARRALADGRLPNTCGIVQSKGGEIDMAVAKLEAARNNAIAFLRTGQTMGLVAAGDLVVCGLRAGW